MHADPGAAERGLGGARAITGASIAAAFGLPLLICLPWDPIVSTSPYGYEYAIHLAHASGWQHGTQIAATYGPWGFVAIPLFHPRTFGPLLLLSVLLYGLAILRLWGFVRAARPGWAPAFGVWTGLVLVPTSMTEWAPILFLAYLHALLLGSEGLLPGSRTGPFADLLSLAMIVLFSLIKVTFLPLALLALAVLVMRERGWRWRTAWVMAWGGFFVGLWVLSGQSLLHLPAFLRVSVEIASGYKSALALWTPYPALLRWLFWGLVSATLLALAWRCIRPVRWSRWPPLVLILACLTHIFLTGFVRLDRSHLIPSFVFLCSSIALLSGVFARRVLVLLAVSLGANGAVALGLWRAGVDGIEWRRPVREAQAMPHRILGWDDLKQQRGKELADLRARWPLGSEPGSLDVQGADLDIAHANGLGLELRPTITSYAASTPALSRLNAEFLERPSGPSLVWSCGPGAVDERYPTLSDSLSFVSLLTHFEHRAHESGCNLFERKAATSYRLNRLLSRSVAFEESVSVPQVDADGVWATIAIEPNLRGRLLAAAFKPAPLYLDATLSNGTAVTHRIDGPLAGGGFLLSPYLGDSLAMAVFYSRSTRIALRSVSSIRISDRSLPRSSARRFHREPIEIELFSVVVER